MADIPSKHIYGRAQSGDDEAPCTPYTQLLDAVSEKPYSPLSTLMRLVRGEKGESLAQALEPLLPQGSAGHARFFGHHGLGGEFGNSIGQTLMDMRGFLLSSPYDEARMLRNLERIRHCWREKWSKATEYGDRSEVAGAAMRRLGDEIQSYADERHAQGQFPDARHDTVCAQLTEYRAALDAIESLVVSIESMPDLPRRSTPSPRR